MERITVDGRELGLYDGGAGGPGFLLLAGEEGGDALWTLARERTERPFSLAVFPVKDWEEELSPWRAEKVFRDGRDFGDGAGETLRHVENAVLPALREALGRETPFFTVGYSLAGLFALYALFESAAFAGAVSCSGSLWFPGFGEYAAARPFARQPERVYLSLGEKESRTRNPVMARVEERTLAFAALLEERDVPHCMEMNPGNHFREPELRLAKGLAWVAESLGR